MIQRYPLFFFAFAVVVLFGGCGNPAEPDNTPSGMINIPRGTFQMGDSLYYIEQPIHTVTVSSFCMDVTEVTQADYGLLMGVNPSRYIGDSLRPVEQVTLFDALLYCNARSKRDLLDTVYSFTSIAGTPGNGCSALRGLNIDYTKCGYRLPTEAEWEYACRAGNRNTAAYYWGGNYPPTTSADTLAIDYYVVWSHNSTTTARVGTKVPNAWGLYDMSGNVQEWCNDWYGSYSSGAQTDPTGPSNGPACVMRGGPWNYPSPYLRSASRVACVPSFWSYNGGFRCVLR
jgi:sulfatase modifying factor 1